MLFSSVIFVLKFLPFTLVVYFLSPQKQKNIFLLVMSLFFYAWGEPVYVIIMMISIVVNYFFGIFIDRSRHFTNRQKFVLALGVALNLIFLVYFKYVGFIVQNINAILNIHLQVNPVTMPIGISFYTFQSLSYLVDVYRKEVKAQFNIINIGLYISFFPQLIAGPIVRYTDINEQIDQRKIDLSGFVIGIERFIVGLAKKVLIANTLGEVADKIFVLPTTEITTLASWLGVICYAFQIFFDFSGYSDMAIGLGRMFGFRFLENFNFPYIARSIREFWQRWHISLSTWFRDYLYIPLGGNRGSKWRTYINLLIVFFVTGLWHGASWNFIVWGLFHGFFLLLERTKLGIWREKMWSPLQYLYTVLVVLIGWVFFRSETIAQAQSYLQVMFGLSMTENYPFDYFDFLNLKVLVCLTLAIALSMPFPKLKFLSNYQIIPLLRRILVTIILAGILLLSIADLASETYNPFIYFRF
jgi:alginate O-acetyltransferase complex protein AlgI